MSSARIEDPAEMLAKGEKVYCKVISVEVGYLRVENYRSHDLNDLFKTKPKKQHWSVTTLLEVLVS